MILCFGQLSSEQWRELINYSVPLFLLVVFGIVCWKGSRYLGTKVIEPLVDTGKAYLETQNQEARNQTQALTELSSNFKASGENTKASLDILIQMHSDPNSIFATETVRKRVDALLSIQALLAKAVDHAIRSPNGTEVERLIDEIDRICSRFRE